jgi:glycosyltransferase involved in cell wall biosynthesis
MLLYLLMTDLVSIVTCTYNRKDFYDNLKNMIAYQDYPHNKLEWIIMDDSQQDNSSYFPAVIDGITVRYYYLKQKIPLGKKRDLINNAAKGKYIVNMDDDDFYPPCRVSHAIEQLIASGHNLAGSSKMFMFFTKDHSIHQLGPYRENHGTAATLAYTKEYTKTHFFYDPTNGNYAEEGVFTEAWKHPMAQLDPMKTVLALSHTNNTIEKTMFLDEKFGQVGRTVLKTPLKLSDFINQTQHSAIYSFYDTLPYEYKVNDLTKEVVGKMETNAAEAQKAYHVEMLKRMAHEINMFTTWKNKRIAFGV